MDRFRHALEEPETITLITGYSFGDQHLNEIIFDAAQRHPRSETVALCYESIPPVVLEASGRLRNLMALSDAEAIVGGIRGTWSAEDTEIPGVWAAGRFLLSDFRHLSAFLGTTRGDGSSDLRDLSVTRPALVGCAMCWARWLQLNLMLAWQALRQFGRAAFNRLGRSAASSGFPRVPLSSSPRSPSSESPSWRDRLALQPALR